MSSIRQRNRPRLLLAAMAVLMALATACGTSASSDTSQTTTLRLGYFPNLTHAPAIVGIDRGIYSKDLGGRVSLKTETFNAGPAAVEALFGGAIDASFVGPNPAINAYIKSHGSAVRIVSGSTLGGAALVVRPAAHINSPSDLRRKQIATPQLGNTQDVALRTYLKAHGMKTNPQGGGDVKIVAADNATTLQLFKSGQIDGAWVPEPYASRLVDEDGGKVLVDEASLWPQGRFVTTVLIVSTSFLNAHQDVVKNLIRGERDTIDWINSNPSTAKQTINAALKKLTQKSLKSKVLDDAFSHLTFTVDPDPSALQQAAANAEAVGLLKSTSLSNICDLRLLNSVLKSAGQPAVDAGSLGTS